MDAADGADAAEAPGAVEAGDDVITVTHQTPAPPSQVWAVMADGWSYAGWVVGTSRIRAVDPSWPSQGAKIHHSAGSWPLMLSDETVVLSSEPLHRLRLRAKGRPFGEVIVELVLTPKEGGTLVEIREDIVAGPTRVIPKPVRQLMIGPRNTETLRRLALLAERRTSPSG